ncbi:hypothetical protein, partial [Flavonifractor plautii]|uniref:hypothetical protein n=1 Tax=Flavonifractor plautii TaxID=292800 RepID=UPI003D7EDAE5
TAPAPAAVAPDPAAQFGPGFDQFGNRLIPSEGDSEGGGGGSEGGMRRGGGIAHRAPGGDVGDDLMSYSSLLGDDGG